MISSQTAKNRQSLARFPAAPLFDRTTVGLAAGNDRGGRIALRLGGRIMEEGGTGPAAVPVPELLAFARPEIAPPFRGMALLALAIEAAVALEEAGVIGDVVPPGPRGSEIVAHTLLPPYRPGLR